MSIKIINLRNKILTIFGDIKINKHFPWIPYYKPEGYKIKGKQTRDILNLCKPGDVFIRGFDNYLDGYFIGHWSHVALVVNSNEIMHALAEGVITEDLITFLRTDRIAIIRPKLEEEKLLRVIQKAESLMGMPYDFEFNFDSPKEMSCTEFVYCCFEEFAAELFMKKSQINILFIKKNVIKPKSFLQFGGFSLIYFFERI